MATAPERRRAIVRFGIFEMDLNAGELRKNGNKLKLQRQPFEVLAALVQRSPEVLTREELRSALWPTETYVDFDHGLNNSIEKLRKTLGDSATSPHFIETVPRRGYRFIAQVETVCADRQVNAIQDQRDDIADTLTEIRQQLVMAKTVSDLRKLHIRTETLLEQKREHARLHEVRELHYEIQQALDNTIARSITSREMTVRRVYGAARGAVMNGEVHRISDETAACVFDDANALSRYCGFGSWITLGNVRGQIIVVSHTVEERSGREI